MELVQFYNELDEILRLHNSDVHQSFISEQFLRVLKEITFANNSNKLQDYTNSIILFEGFYKHLEQCKLKDELLLVRANWWKAHFGMPTITFLLSYNNQIDRICNYFNDNNDSLDLASCLIADINNLIVDTENNILVKSNCISQVNAPIGRESTGIFTKTYNPFGGFTTSPCDPVSQKFIEHAAASAKLGGKVLEIGAAFGAATLEAIAKGATVFCNDIDPQNLAVVHQRYVNDYNSKTAVSGDSNKLVLIPGELPQELIGLPKNHFDAILICRVLHFFSGSKIDQALSVLSHLLAPKGKIYIVCETPYLKNWRKFISEFDRRVAANQEWPGEIHNPALFESSGRVNSLPKFVHWITKEVLDRSLIKAGFSIEHSEYINRDGQFPEDLLLPEYGKESIGAIGLK